MSRVTLQIIDQWNDIAKEATTGPWVWSDIKDSGSGGSHASLVNWGGRGNISEPDGSRTFWLGPNEFDDKTSVMTFHQDINLKAEDGDLIALSRLAVPGLIAEVRRLNNLLSQVSGWVKNSSEESDRTIRKHLSMVINHINKSLTPSE